jgi:hypothetical protein
MLKLTELKRKTDNSIPLGPLTSFVSCGERVTLFCFFIELMIFVVVVVEK